MFLFNTVLLYYKQVIIFAAPGFRYCNINLFVYIASLPQIYLHPMSKIVRITNDSVRIDFICMADGALSYFWLKENGSISSTAEGINTNNLLLQNILPSDSGRYQCVAVNENGRSYSNYATLTVEGNYIIIVIL